MEAAALEQERGLLQLHSRHSKTAAMSQTYAPQLPTRAAMSFVHIVEKEAWGEEATCSISEFCRVTETRHIGCLILNAERRVILVGERAERLLRRGGLRVEYDRSLATERADQTLELQKAMDLAAEGQRMPLVALDRSACRSPLVVGVSIVNLYARHVPQAVPHEGYVLCLRDPLWFDTASVEELKQLYGLTHRESELALHLASGGDLTEFAESRCVSMNTVKSHLKQVFNKVGVRAQAQLISHLHCLLH